MFLAVLIFVVMINLTVQQDGDYAFANSIDIPPMSLTLVASNGTKLVLSSRDIASLTFYRAYGGFVNQLGYLKNLGNYTGVPLITFCDLVGGLNNGSSLQIIGSDNYSMTLTYEQVNGNWTTYDKVTGQPLGQSQPLKPILAYYFNDANLSTTEGPLRLAVVGPEGLLTDSKYWVYSVVKIEITDASVPEFSPTMLPVFTIATIIVTLIYRKRFRTPDREPPNNPSRHSGASCQNRKG
jgi:hypothetical protein